MNEKTPDPKIINLTFKDNQRWIAMMGFIWAVLMLPCDIASIHQGGGLMIVLAVMGIVAFIILFEIKVRKLTGGLSLAAFRKAHPESSVWPLFLGICAWSLFFRMGTPKLLELLSVKEMFGGMGGTV
jgi:hypothetical protein